jgi:DNA-binding transcriptional LysR family regulator
MSFEVSQLRQFVALAEELHFARAARRCFVTQPAISRQLQSLERALGARLMERDRRTVRLSEAGVVFLAEARDVLARAEVARERMAQVSRGEAGRLNLGYENSTLYGVFPRLLQRLNKEIPGTALDLNEQPGAALLRGMADGVIDAALMHPPVTSPEYVVHVLARETLVVAVPDSSALARRKSLTLRDLVSAPQVAQARAQNPEFYEWRMALWRAHSVTPNIICEADGKSTLIALVAAGIGVAIVPESFCKLRLPGVRYVPIDAALPPIETAFVWRRANPSRVLARVVALIESRGVSSIAVGSSRER